MLSFMRTHDKRITALAAALVMIFSLLPGVSVSAQQPYAPQGVNVSYRTAQEIRDYVGSNAARLMDYSEIYAVQPSLEAPYTVTGELSEEAEAYAITMLNNIRYVAGLDPVTLDTGLQKLAQTGSDVCFAMDTITHYPKSAGYTASNLNMDSELFESGCTAVSESNLAYRMMRSGSQFTYEYTEHCDSIMLGLMADEDQYNIDVVGHRRWMINPVMGKTGYGQTSSFTGTQYKDFGVLYAFDRSNTSASQYGVMWPAQTMPVEYFGNNVPWSISMGRVLDADAVTVTLTRLSDNTVWRFSKNSADGFFNVDNAGYGQKGCIIFRPDGIRYAVGDAFRVDISGVGTAVSYRVDFMSLYYDSADEAEMASHLSFSVDPETNTATVTSFDDAVADIVIPASYKGRPVTKIAQSLAFCENVKTVVIPDSVREIGDFAFYQCANLESVTLGSGVESIGASAFSKCTKLADVEFKKNVKTLGRFAFNECAALESVTLCDGVETIGYGAFNKCTGLNSAAFTSSVTLIDEYAFGGCTALAHVYFTGTEDEWKAISVQSGNGALSRASIHYVEPVSEPDFAVQLSADGSAIRFFAAADSLDYREVGFEITVTDAGLGVGSAVLSDTAVYTAIALGEYELKSENFGVENGYVYMLTVNGIPSEFTVSVRPFKVDLSGETQYAEAKEYTVANGEAK